MSEKSETKFKSIRPYDRVIVGERQWSVVSVYIGALGHDNVAELVCADGRDSPTLLVPLDLIPANTIFREVDHAALVSEPSQS